LPGETSTVKTVDIETLLQSSGRREIDILKVDIEGAEKIVFSKNYEEWIKKEKNIFIELHDEECKSNFLVVPPSAFRRNPWFGKLLGYGRPQGGRHARA
jgi:hypothetical protein